MPLTAAEVSALDGITTRIVRLDIGVELAEYYGAAVFHNNSLKPEQPNNEIRNALNHLARAYEVDSWTEAQKEIEAAERHILRAKRDALKLAIIGLFDEIRDLLQSIRHHYGTLSPAIVIRRADLVRRRREVYARESAGHSGTGALMLGLFVDSTHFFDELQAEFPATSSAAGWRIRLVQLRRQLMSIAVGFVLGVLASLLASYLWDRLHSHPASAAAKTAAAQTVAEKTNTAGAVSSLQQSTSAAKR